MSPRLVRPRVPCEGHDHTPRPPWQPCRLARNRSRGNLREAPPYSSLPHRTQGTPAPMPGFGIQVSARHASRRFLARIRSCARSGNSWFRILMGWKVPTGVVRPHRTGSVSGSNVPKSRSQMMRMPPWFLSMDPTLLLRCPLWCEGVLRIHAKGPSVHRLRVNPGLLEQAKRLSSRKLGPDLAGHIAVGHQPGFPHNRQDSLSERLVG